jgi:hypothetical protein
MMMRNTMFLIAMSLGVTAAFLQDVRFEHDGRISKGHFANMTEAIHETKEA